MKSALWLADYVGSVMTAGAVGSPTTFLPIDADNRVEFYPPQYLAAQVITREWAQPVDAVHKPFKAASGLKDRDGNILVTAYALQRPDGQWSVMLVNKDDHNEHPSR